MNKSEPHYHYEIEHLEERLNRNKALLSYTSVRIAEIKSEIKAKKKMLDGSHLAKKTEID